MKLNPPKKTTFWAAVVVAAVGVIIYAVHVFLPMDVRLLGGAGFLVLLAAFVLLCLGLTLKGF